MDPEQYKELLRKMGIGEDQFKYFTTEKEDLPGLYGFTGEQSKRFLEQFGGMPKFDPFKAMEAYGEVERYGKERTTDIGQQVKSGISGVQSGLISGVKDVVSGIGKGLGRRFGGTQKSISDVRESAYEAGSDVKRKGTMALSNLSERLGARRAAVGKTGFDYLGGLMNLSGGIFGLDPGDAESKSFDKHGLIEGVEIDVKMPTGAEARFATDQLTQYFQSNNLNTGGDEELWNRYIAEFAQARESNPSLTVDNWWKNTYGAN